MPLPLFLLLLLLIGSACVPRTVSAKAAPATAGWAEVEITPPLGIALGGRGGNYTLARQVLDPLYAQLLFIKDGQGRGLVIVSLDLIGLPHSLSDELRQSLVYELGVEWNLVLLNTSHTHSGPNMLRELMAGVGPAPEIEQTYFDSLREKVLLAARTARKNLAPVASIEIFNGTSQVAINRRGRNNQGKIGIIPDPNGPIDPNLWAMRIRRQDGGDALIFSYACHPVIVYGYAFAAISADFPGVTRRSLREQDPKIAHVQYLQGLAGNVRPRSLADFEKKTFIRGGDEQLQATGEQLASDLLSIMRRKGEPLTPDFAGSSDRPFLPRGELPSREVYEKMTVGGVDVSNAHSKELASYWLKRYDSGEGFAKGEAWPVGLIRLSKRHFIAHMAGEPVAEWRKQIESWLSPRKVLVIGYSQEAITYLPTENLLGEGGYEVIDSNRARMSSPAPFATGIERAMKESFVRQLSFIEASGGN